MLSRWVCLSKPNHEMTCKEKPVVGGARATTLPLILLFCGLEHNCGFICKSVQNHPATSQNKILFKCKNKLNSIRISAQ